MYATKPNKKDCSPNLLHSKFVPKKETHNYSTSITRTIATTLKIRIIGRKIENLIHH